MNEPAFARVARYSGRKRPAWRMIQIGVRSTGSRSRARRKRSFLSSVIAPFNYFVGWAAHQRSPIFTEIPGLLLCCPGFVFFSFVEVVEYPFRRIAALEHRGHYQIGAAHHVAAREDFRIGRLEFMLADRRRAHAAALVALDAELGETRRRVGLEAEGDDDAIGRDDLFRAGHDLRRATAARIGRAELGRHYFHAFDLVVADELDGLAIPKKLHAFFLGVGDLALRARHVSFVAAIGAKNAHHTLADRAAIAIHRGVAAAQHHHALALHVDEVTRARQHAELLFDVRHQVRQRFMHAGRGGAGEAARHVRIGAHAQKHRVVFIEQFLERDIFADLGVEHELDAHLLEQLAACAHHFFYEFEFGDTEGQQTADLLVAIEHHGFDAVAHQYIRAAQPHQTRADERDAQTRRDHARHVGPPAAFQCLAGDIFFDRTDGDGAEAVVERARAFAEAILRAHAAAHLGQRIGAMRQLRRFEDVVFLDQLEPVGNVVVNRALPLAIGVAATQTARCLRYRIFGIELAVDLAEILEAHRGHGPRGILARDLDELEIFCHCTANLFGHRRHAALSRTSSRELISSALGFTSQQRGRYAAKSSRILWFFVLS